MPAMQEESLPIRYVLGDYSILAPKEWTVMLDREAGTYIAAPPRGEGRLVFLEATHSDPPPVTESYAREQASRAVASIDLSPDELVLEQDAEDHYWLWTEGHARGRYVFATVHVFSPGRVVSAVYHAAAPDEFRPYAGAIAASLEPIARVVDPVS